MSPLSRHAQMNAHLRAKNNAAVTMHRRAGIITMMDALNGTQEHTVLTDAVSGHAAPVLLYARHGLMNAVNQCLTVAAQPVHEAPKAIVVKAALVSARPALAASHHTGRQVQAQSVAETLSPRQATAAQREQQQEQRHVLLLRVLAGAFSSNLVTSTSLDTQKHNRR